MPINAGWKPEFSVGIEAIDRQHQIILGLCDALAESVKTTGSVSDSAFHEILNQMAEYTREHFADEERWLKLVGYKDIDTHIDEHHSFNDEVAEIALESSMGSNEKIRLQRFITQWWIDHILKEDMKYTGLCPQT